MAVKSKSQLNDNQPPVLGSWRRVYWFVALFFVVEVGLFYLFTRFYS